MIRHRISMDNINELRRMFIKGNFNQVQAAKSMHINRSTVLKYIKKFEDIREHYPAKLGNLDFFMPVPSMAHRSTLLYDELITALPGIMSGIHTRKLNITIVWKLYRKLCPDGYSYTPFKETFKAWCIKNEVAMRYSKLIETIPDDDWDVINKWRRQHSDRRKWQLAVELDAAYNRKPLEKVAAKIEMEIRTVYRWIKMYNERGLSGLEIQPKNVSQAVTDRLQIICDNLIKLIHHTPKIYGINRTSWTCIALAETFQKVYGFYLSAPSVSRYLKKLGYSFRSSREMLTSPDPEFPKKIKKIQQILANLGSRDKFFSIDEYGPVSIKMRGGISLLHESEQLVTISQYQRSRGFLICTAALELSTNQITHFYSTKKNSAEMIKLIDLLISKYQDQDRLYLSWDAVSWHNSFILKDHIKELNSKLFRQTHHTPTVRISPLPSYSQFLNVIESVFSGLARAVIHNSDYADVAECQSVIDRYFEERNNHYLNNPKRAGHKIWGQEIVLPVFKETQHCRNTHAMRGNCK